MMFGLAITSLIMHTTAKIITYIPKVVLYMIRIVLLCHELC